MSDFTEDQLKAMREGTTPAPWSEDVIYPDCSCIVDDTDGRDVSLAYTARALLDALIAEKQVHAKLRAEVEAMKSAFDDRPSPHDDHLYAQGWDHALDLVDTGLARILEGDNE